MNSAPVAIDRGAFAFLEDSVVLAMRSESEEDFEIGATLARSSILATMLFVEACANTCLDMLALDSAFASDVASQRSRSSICSLDCSAVACRWTALGMRSNR